MRILFLGDLVGRSGRDAVTQNLPGLRRRLSADMVIANGENAAWDGRRAGISRLGSRTNW